MLQLIQLNSLLHEVGSLLFEIPLKRKKIKKGMKNGKMTRKSKRREKKKKKQRERRENEKQKNRKGHEEHWVSFSLYESPFFLIPCLDSLFDFSFLTMHGQT